MLLSQRIILFFHIALLIFVQQCNGQRASILTKLVKHREKSNRKRSSNKSNFDAEATGDAEKDVVVNTYGSDDLGLSQECEVEWENIKMTLSQKKSKEDKLLLDGSIRGKISSGRMLAIMGPSGAGKTTACLAIAGRIPYSKKVYLEGNRYLNGRPLSGDSELPAAFVKQDDSFFPQMTVKETLDFRVELKLGRKLNKADRDAKVDELLDLLSLSKVANTIVGDIKVRGISGGERKRLSIACELISSPAVIILDEPTSGLDSYQAYQVVSALRKLAEEGKTVISVIHQPSQQVFSMFDDLLLISEGRQMYFGEVKKVREYFNGLGYESDDEIGTAEFVIDLISSNEFEGTKERLDKIANEAKDAVSKLKFSAKDLESDHYYMMKNFSDRRCVSGILKQFKLLFLRSLRETFRGKATIIIKAVQQVSTALIYGGIYNLGNDQASIRDRIGLISLIAIGSTNLAMASTIRSFPKEKSIVTGEISAKLYKTFPYFISKAISEIPLIAGLSMLFGSVIYPLVGFQKEKFSTFLGLSSLHSIASQSAGLLVGSISPSSDVSLALFPPIIVLNIIFDGKNISAESVPRLLRWLPKVGLIRWGYEGMCVNEFKGLEFKADGPFRGPSAKTGDEALERYGLEGASIERAVKAQLTIIGVSWFLSFMGLSATKQKYVQMSNAAQD